MQLTSCCPIFRPDTHLSYLSFSVFCIFFFLIIHELVTSMKSFLLFLENKGPEKELKYCFTEIELLPNKVYLHGNFQYVISAN